MGLGSKPMPGWCEGPPVLVNTLALSEVLGVRLGCCCCGGFAGPPWLCITWILVAFHLNGMLALNAASTRTRS